MTGASRGIGHAVATGLALRGVDVLAGVRTVSPSPTLDEIHLDLCDLGEFAPPDALQILVNNAGLDTAYLPVEHMPLDSWRAVFETNVFGLVELTRRCIPVMRTNGGGVIVNITSASLAVGMPLYACYRASKAAVAAFGESLSAEVAAFGIRVVEVAPGPIATDMLADSDRLPEAARCDGYVELAQGVWDGRRSIEPFVTPVDVAAARIVEAILDPSVTGRVACDQLGADLTGAPLSG